MSDQETRPAKMLPWAMWGLGAAFYCYGFFQRVAPSVMVEDLMRDFAVSAAVLGNLSAFYFYAYASLQMPVGIMVDHWGPRRVLAAAALLCGLGSLLFATADGILAAYGGRLLIGAGAGFAWVGSLKLAANWFDPRRFALVTGLTLMLGMAGAVFGQAPLAALVEVTGWRGTMSGAAVFALVLAAAILLLARDAPAGASGGEREEGQGLLTGLGTVIRTWQSWPIAVFAGAMTAPMLAFGGLWGVPYLMEAFDLDRPVAAASTSLMLIGWAIGSPLAGWATDFMGRRKVPMLIGGLGALSTFGAMIYAPELPLIAVQALLLVYGIFSGAMVVSFATAREHNHPWASGALLGFVNMFIMSTGAIFQPLVGWILDLEWDGALVDGARVYSVSAYQSAFLTLLACGVLAVTCAALVRETHCRQVRD